MQLYVKIQPNNSVYLRVEGSKTPPPRGAPQHDGTELVDAAAAAGYLAALAAEFRKGDYIPKISVAHDQAGAIQEVPVTALWNWCPTCSQAVDLPGEFWDGVEVTCISCRKLYVITELDEPCSACGATAWHMDVAEAEVCSDCPTPDRCAASGCVGPSPTCEIGSACDGDGCEVHGDDSAEMRVARALNGEDVEREVVVSPLRGDEYQEVE